MIVTSNIQIQKTTRSRVHEVDFSKLEFGKLSTDHMFIAEYRAGEWQDARIVPFGNLSLSPFSLGLHYGQTIFEGMKAFRMADGNISIFRPEKNHERFNLSAHRMCMAEVPKDLFMDALHQFVALEHEWVPKTEGSSLYLRPFMFATEARLGVKPADEYYFMIVASPVGPYYSQPVKVKVEMEYARAAEGGTGYAKCGGNYGGSLYPAMLAKKAGFDQVLWTDAKTHSFIEESGTMNVMFRFGDVVVTPTLSSSILDGVTRDSILTLAEDMGYGVEEREVPVAELEQRLQNGSCKEAFGAGTAAVIAPIEYIDIHGESYRLNIQPDALMYQIKKRLNDIRMGNTEDIYGWNYIIKP